MPADGNQGSGQLLNIPSTLSLRPNNSAVDPFDLRFVLSKVIVQIDDVECVVFVEQGEGSGRRESSTDGQDHILGSQSRRRVWRALFYAYVHGPRVAVDRKVNRQFLLNGRLDRTLRSHKDSYPVLWDHCGKSCFCHNSSSANILLNWRVFTFRLLK